MNGFKHNYTFLKRKKSFKQEYKTNNCFQIEDNFMVWELRSCTLVWCVNHLINAENAFIIQLVGNIEMSEIRKSADDHNIETMNQATQP